MEHFSPAELRELKPGSWVLATFPQDNQVYRASVEEIIKNQDTEKITRFKVRFIDYGNTSLITKDHLFKWDSTLETIPPQAFCLKLKDCSRIDTLVKEGSKQYEEFNKILVKSNPCDVSVVARLHSSSYSQPHVYTPELLVSLHSSGRSIFRILQSSPLFRDCISEAPATTSLSLTSSVLETLNQDRLKILDYKTPARLSQVPEPVHLTGESPADDDPVCHVHPVLASRAVEKVTWWMRRDINDNTKDDAGPVNNIDQHQHGEEVDLEAPASQARRKQTVEQKKMFMELEEASSEVCKTSTLSLKLKKLRQACNSEKASSEPAVSRATAEDGHLGARPKRESSTAAKTPSSRSTKSRTLDATRELLNNAKIKRKGGTDASAATKNQGKVFNHSSSDGVNYPSRDVRLYKRSTHQHASQAEVVNSSVHPSPAEPPNTHDEAKDSLKTNGDSSQAELNSCVHSSEAEVLNTNVDSSLADDALSRQADSDIVKPSKIKSPLIIKQQRIQVAYN